MLKNFLFHRPAHHTMTLCTGVLVLCQWLSACSSIQDLPAAVNGRSVYGSWLDLNDARKLTLSPGVFLELPDAPIAHGSQTKTASTSRHPGLCCSALSMALCKKLKGVCTCAMTTPFRRPLGFTPHWVQWASHMQHL